MNKPFFKSGPGTSPEACITADSGFHARVLFPKSDAKLAKFVSFNEGHENLALHLGTFHGRRADFDIAVYHCGLRLPCPGTFPEKRCKISKIIW